MAKYIKYVIIAFFIALYIFLLTKYNIGIPCIFYKITGLYCPGCGGNRAIISLIHLNFGEAISNNLLLTLSIPLILVYVFIKYVLKKNIKLTDNTFVIISIITIAFGILRNIPFFIFLAPVN